MSVRALVAGTTNAVESVWVVYALTSNAFGIYSLVPPSPPWQELLFLVQMVLAFTLLFDVLLCLKGSEKAYLAGAVLSLGILVTLVPEFGVWWLPLVDSATAGTLSLMGVLANVWAGRGAANSEEPMIIDKPVKRSAEGQ